MNQQNTSTPLKTRRSWITWVVTGIAFFLGLLALIVAFQDLVGSQRIVSLWILGLDFMTGLSGILGTFGYVMGKRWGIYSFGVSVFGHFVSHTMLIVSAIMNNRVSVYSIGGLLVIPIIALIILSVMIFDSNKRASV